MAKLLPANKCPQRHFHALVNLKFSKFTPSSNVANRVFELLSCYRIDAVNLIGTDTSPKVTAYPFGNLAMGTDIEPTIYYH